MRGSFGGHHHYLGRLIALIAAAALTAFGCGDSGGDGTPASDAAVNDSGGTTGQDGVTTGDDSTGPSDTAEDGTTPLDEGQEIYKPPEDTAIQDGFQHRFEITIDNQTGDVVFLDAVSSTPYGILNGGVPVATNVYCPCSYCGTEELCKLPPDTIPLAVALPAGESVLVAITADRAESMDVGAECPEAGEPMACQNNLKWTAGTYEVVLRWDTQDAIAGQGLESTTAKQWGLTLWKEPVSTEGLVDLQNTASANVDVTIGQTTTATITLN